MTNLFAATLILAFLAAPSGVRKNGYNKFASVGISNPNEVKDFFEHFRQSIRSGDHHEVLSFMAPIVTINGGGKSVKINRVVILKKYNYVFNRYLKAEISCQKFEDLFVNWRGVVGGNGKFYINLVDIDGNNSHYVSSGGNIVFDRKFWVLKIVSVNVDPIKPSEQTLCIKTILNGA